jgi:hypothetical protein
VKKLIISGLSLMIGIGWAALGVTADATTVSGHLRDGFCYTIMGAHGPSHKKCAIACARKGIPVMLVEDKTDKAYVLLPAKDGSSLPDAVIDKMEDEVTLTGQAYSKNGVEYFQVQSVK